jgi:hypothetical protein
MCGTYRLRRAADEIRIVFFFQKAFGMNKINELVVSRNLLLNTITGPVTSDLGPDVVRGPPVDHTVVTYRMAYMYNLLIIYLYFM